MGATATHCGTCAPVFVEAFGYRLVVGTPCMTSGDGVIVCALRTCKSQLAPVYGRLVYAAHEA